MDHGKADIIVGYDKHTETLANNMKTVSGALAYDNPTSCKTVIIVIHQVIHVPTMDCNLICPMQVRMNDVKLDDKPKFLIEDPTDESTYMKHLFGSYNSGIAPTDDPFHPFLPDEYAQQTLTQMRTYLIQHLPDPHGPEPVPSGSISSTRPTGYSMAAIELMGFKKGIKRNIAAYPSLKDERYFDGFKRSLFIVEKSHECNKVLDPTYTPGSEPE